MRRRESQLSDIVDTDWDGMTAQQRAVTQHCSTTAPPGHCLVFSPLTALWESLGEWENELETLIYYTNMLNVKGPLIFY